MVEKFSLEAAAQKIGPEKFTEWRRILSEAAGSAQLARQRPERIVDQIGNAFWNIAIGPPHPFGVIGMHPVAVVHHRPKRVTIQSAEVVTNDDRHLFDPLLMQGAGKVMMIDDIRALLRAQDYRNDMLAEKLLIFLRAQFAPAFPFVQDLAHANGNLRGPQISDGNCRYQRFADYGHISRPLTLNRYFL